MERITELKRTGPDTNDMPEPAPYPKQPFPYWPEVPTENSLKRIEMTRQLDLWENNDHDIARSTAKTFIELLKRQFDLPGE